jgi:hypothetical protein
MIYFFYLILPPILLKSVLQLIMSWLQTLVPFFFYLFQLIINLICHTRTQIWPYFGPIQIGMKILYPWAEKENANNGKGLFALSTVTSVSSAPDPARLCSSSSLARLYPHCFSLQPPTSAFRSREVPRLLLPCAAAFHPPPPLNFKLEWIPSRRSSRISPRTSP